MQKFAYLLPRVLLLAAVTVLTACGGTGGVETSDANAGDDSSNNASPTISGQPGSEALAGYSYAFQPSAEDPEGATLEFSVQNLPSWAAFDTATGRLSGTPDDAAVGNYSGIVITVSDGTQSASLEPFSIEVIGIGTGVATLSWTPPTTNADGSVLNNLVGYRVFYGRSASNLFVSIEVDNPSISTYMVEGLATGTWYFGVAAVNANGDTSVLSNTATKTIS